MNSGDDPRLEISTGEVTGAELTLAELTIFLNRASTCKAVASRLDFVRVKIAAQKPAHIVRWAKLKQNFLVSVHHPDYYHLKHVAIAFLLLEEDTFLFL